MREIDTCGALAACEPPHWRKPREGHDWHAVITGDNADPGLLHHVRTISHHIVTVWQRLERQEMQTLLQVHRIPSTT